MANLTEDIVLGYYDYQKLYDGLIKEETNFYNEFEIRFNKSHLSYSLKNSKVETNFSFKTFDAKNKRKNVYINRESEKRKYNMDYFAKFFNGIFFESLAVETLFKIIDEENNNNNRSGFKFLP